MDSNHVKALCRLGEALLQLKDIEGAHSALSKVHQLDPKDAQVRQLLRQVLQLKKEESEKAKAMYRNIFS